MKCIFTFTLASLLLVNSSFAQSATPPTAPQDHVIQVPPWRSDVSHKEAKDAIIKWSESASSFSGTPIQFDDTLETDEPRAGGNSFVAKKLTPAQAAELQSTFGSWLDKQRGPNDKPAYNVIVSRDITFLPEPLFLPKDTITTKGLAETWAVDEVVPQTLNMQSQAGIPRLYVVDTGFQPFVPDGTTSSGAQWNAEFFPLASQGNLRLFQGINANGVSVSLWPKTANNAANEPWNAAAHAELIFTPATLKPCPDITNYVDPQKDPYSHGTTIVSTAIGAQVGLLSKITVGGTSRVSVDVQSIRIYKSTGGHDITPATASAVSNGIFRAVDSHLLRSASSPARSVLLFASRSTSDFVEVVENALWWAWYNGMIVVTSGGNEPGGSSPAEMHIPNSIWYLSTGLPSLRPTTPSKYDWTIPNGNPTAAGWWPNPTTNYTGGLGTLTIPRPNHAYLLMTGGHARTFDSAMGMLTGTDNWRTTFTGTPPYTGSSIGPDIDVNCPSIRVPSVAAGSNPLVKSTGTSITTGFVAGAALAYLATKTTIRQSTQADPKNEADYFREWLLPALEVGPGNGCADSTAAAWNGTAYRKSPYYDPTGMSPYHNHVPKLRITALPPP